MTAGMWICWGYAAAVLGVQVHRWSHTYRFLGHPCLRYGFGVLRFSCRTPKVTLICAATVGFVAAGLATAVATGFHQFRPLLAFYLAFAASCAAILSRNAQPPAVLFLGASRDDSGALLRDMGRVIWPLRAVALLDSRRLPLLLRLDVYSDNLRTRDARSWKSIVHSLIDMAPTVVVDARSGSHLVAEETLWMLAPVRAGKALFLIGTGGECPALAGHGIDPSAHALTTVDERSLMTALRERTYWPAETFSPPQQIDAPVQLDVVDEHWDHLPSTLAIGAVPVFDSSALTAAAISSDKDVLSVLLPLCNPDSEFGQRLLRLSWEFAYDARLAAMYLSSSGVLLVRIPFLREHREELGHYHAEVPTLPLAWEQLNAPEPVSQAAETFFNDICRVAGRHGMYGRPIAQ